MSTRPTVLLVDDDDVLLTTTRAVLEEEFTVTVVRSALEALSALRRARFDVVCADHQMPGMTGSDFLTRVASEHPHTGRVLLSGMSEYFHEQDGDGDKELAILLKPYDPARLIQTLWRLIRIARMRRAVADLRGSVPKGER